MATDSTNLPQGELTSDAGNDMSGSELEFGSVQLAQVTADGGQPVQLPQGQQTVLIPVQPGQTLTLPTDSPNGLLAKIGPEGNLAIVVDGRTIILQGYVQANDQAPVRVVTSDGDEIDVADVVAATDPSLDIQTAAGPATGGQGDSLGNGIFTPFVAGPALGGLDAIGVLDPTALNYKLIDDVRREDIEDEDTGPTNIDITFDILGGVINEDDLFAIRAPELQAFKLVVKDQGNDGQGNDPFDGKDREEGGLDSDGDDGVPDPDREPLVSVATVKVTFGPDIPGTLWVDLSNELGKETPTGLTSEGEPIIYQVLPPSGLQGNGIIAFVDADLDGKYTDGVDRPVFDIKVLEKSSANVFHVAFSLYDNIDNEAPDQNGDGVADLLGGDEQILGLPIKVTAKDSDGTPLSTVMELGVEDDIPFFGEVVFGEGIEIISTGAGVTHDETIGVQGDADDQTILSGDALSLLFNLATKITDAGFSLPFGDSEGALNLFGIPVPGLAQTQVIASFGADQQTQEQLLKADDASARNSIFGALEDATDRDGDGLDDGENERPFELFMIENGTGGVPAEDNKNTVANEGNLTISDQPTNAWVWFNGQLEQVFIHQIDAQTIVGYINLNDGGGDALKASFISDPDSGLETVFVLNIDDEGVLSFVQLHQINHPDGSNADEPFEILGEDGEPLIHVRISDYDGDHAQQPVKIVVQDDAPKFIDVCFTKGNGTVDEDFLPGGNLDLDLLVGGGKGDDQPADLFTTTAGTINFWIGADKPGTLSFGDLVITDSKGNTIDIADLKTADGNGVTIVPSGPDGDGVITLTAIEDGTGDPVFTMTLDSSGGDMGDFKFTLHQALSHPYTDSDYNNDDNPEEGFEDNLNFAFNVVATDVDNDKAQGTIKIVVDDDSPVALDDHDVVTEGADKGGNLNFASGNVVTGNDANLLGKDANFTFLPPLFTGDGTPDGPGADRPYTISKLAHDGDVYTLSDDGATVLKNGSPLNNTTETFDGKILKIPTAEGGTFEIVMISNTQSEVGEYRYTVPENAVHKHGERGGPADEAASMTNDFNEVDEWTDSFADAGITLVPANGDLALKVLSISGPQYRGIGVGGNGDETEVDNVGPDQTLSLLLSNPADNVALTIGALYSGGPDAGFQEILLWQVFDGATLVASGQILGSESGLVPLDIDTNGVEFDRIVLTPIDNGAGNNGNNSDFVLVNAKICCPEDEFTEKFDYTLRDSDGDEDTASLCIDVKDTEPKIRDRDAEVKFLVDEDGIANGLKDTQVDDAKESTSGGNVDNDGIHKGKISFTAGADPVTIELSVSGGDTGLETVDGKKVLAAWDPATSTLIGYVEGTDPSNTGNQVFTVKIDNHQTGQFTFTLLKPVEHPDFDPNESGDDENNPDLSFKINFQIEDKDCDAVYGEMIVTIDDDMPVITTPSGSFSLYVDESLDGNSTPNNAGDHPHNPGTRIEDDEDGAGLPGVLTGLGGVIGASKAGASGLFSYSAGADGLQSAVYSLTITGGGATGLIDSQSNSAITLVQNGNVIEGRSASGNHLVFAFTINASTGEVSMAQYRAINHGNEEPAPGNHDEVKSMNSGVLSVTLTVTDKDDDTVSKSVDISGNIKFDDDGPKAKIEKKEHGDNQVLHDESEGLQNDDQPNGSLPGVFSAVGLIGWARSGDPVVTASDSSYGTDGPGTTVFSLKADFEGVNSGLDDTATGQNIYLYTMPDGTVQGRVGGVGGELAFHISINPNGTIDVAQYRAIEHPDDDDHDEDVGISNSALQAVVTVTDKDGDSDTDSVDIGSRVRFDDDGPHADIEKACGAQIVLDESVDPASGPYADPNANDEAGNVANDIGYAKVAGNLLFTDNSSFGTDGPGTKVYSLDIPGNGTDSGLDDVGTGRNILLYQINATTIEGYAVGSGADPLVFRITVNPANGEVTVVQFRAVEHDNAGDSAATHDEASSPEIMNQNKLFLVQTIYDGDDDSDSDAIDLGKLIKFEDDGPVAVDDVDSVDEDSGAYAIGNVYDGDGNTSFGNDANGTDGNKDDIGSDGASQLKWKDPASGSGFDGNGNVVGQYGTLYVQSDGDYKYVLDEDNPALADLDDGEVLYDTFDYVIYDKDGDSSTATLKITINGNTDAVPPSAEDATAKLDEDGLPNGFPLFAASGDDNADALPDTVPGEAVFGTTLPVNWNGFPGTISLTAGAWGGIMTIDGHAIEVDPASTSTLLIGRDATTHEKVFEVEVLDQLTGAYEVRLFKALTHPDSNNNPADDATDFGAGAYEDNLIIPVNVNYANAGGSVDRVLNIDVDDDAPTWQLVQQSPGVLDDEGAPLPGYTGIEGASAGFDWLGAPVSALIHSVFVGGADGLHSVVLDADQIANLNSALRATDGTADGAPIAFAFEGADLVARISDATSPLNGREVLRLHPEATMGDFTLTQSSPIFHVGQGEQDALLKVTLKGIDHDGDASSVTVNFQLNDDMPDLTNVTITIDGDGKLIHDETAGVDGDADDVATRPATLDAFEGAHPGELEAIGYAHSVINLAVSGVPGLAGAYGADGQGAAPILKLTKADGGDFNGEQSNLVDTATGLPILLYTESSPEVVVGRVGGEDGPIAFVLRLDGDTGAFDLGQYRAIKHPLTGNDGVNHDDAITLLNNGGTSGLLHVTLTLTDGDNDTVSKTVPFDGFQGNPAVVFQDDGPTARDDTDSVTEDAVPNTATGNVITGAGTGGGTGGPGADTKGTDGASVSKVTGTNSDETFDGGFLEVNGQYGTLKIDADGNYTYTLDNSNPAVDALNDGQQLHETFTYVLKDGDGDTSDAELKITIDGDTDNKIPIAYDDKKCGDEAAPKNANLLLIFDVSGSMNSASGVGGLTKLEAAKQAAINMLTEYASVGGDVRVMLVWFNSSADREEAWLTIPDAIAAINAIPASGNSASTNYEAAILEAISAFNDTDGRGDPANHPGFVYFLSDGEPTTGGNGGDNSITDGTLTSWDNLLENAGNNIDHVYSVGLGTAIPGGASNPNLIDVADPDGNDIAPNTVVLVDDLNDLSATLTGTVGSLIEGNVLDGSIENSDPDGPNAGPNNDPDNVGDGFSHVSFFQYDHPSLNGLDITINWDGTGAIEPGEVIGGTNTAINGTKVTFDTEHGQMTFDLATGDFDFVAGKIDNGDKEEHFTYKITDSNGDPSNPADLTVCIKDVFVDQTPITYDDEATGTEPGPKNVNLLLVFDNSGSMADPSGIPATSKLQAAKTAAINLLNAYAATGGDVRVMLVTFNSSAGRQEVWLDLSAAIAAINAIPQSGSSTNYEAAITTAISGFNDTDGRGSFATHDNLVYFLSDGEPTTGGNSGDNSITDGTLTNWDNLLENPANQVDHVYAVGLGTGIPGGASNPNLLDVANPVNNGVNETPNTVILVDDFNDLSATLTGTVGTPIEGNILNGLFENDADGPNGGAGNDPDFQGDAPAHLSYFEYDSANNDLDIKITWDGVGAVVIDGVADGKSTSVNGKEVSFDTDYGRMTIDFSDGDFKLLAGNISGGDKTEVFNYKITDVDGDVSNQSKLTVTIENLPPTITITDVTVDEGGTANVQVKLSEPAPVGGFSLSYTFGGGTATLGSDYDGAAPGATVFIPAGATTANIQVNAKSDGVFDDNETYNVVISGAPAGWTITDNTGVVTINDVVPTNPTFANNDSIITAINNNSTFVVPHWALLANDTDADGLPLSITDIVSFDGTNFDNVTTSGSGVTGSVSVNTDNPFDPGDTAQFVYKAGDANSNDNATVTVTAVSNADITGTDSGEIIVDSGSGHTVNAGKGNDIVFGNGGGDTLNGGDGDDILVVSDGGGSVNDFTAVNGGSGIDTFRFGDGSSNRTFDLRGTDNELGNIDSIERIDMTDGFDDDVLQIDATRVNALGSASENSNITLTVGDVLGAIGGSFEDDQIDLFVLGDADDVVDTDGESWTNIGSANIGGINYTLYGVNVGGADDAVMAIQNGVDLT